MKLFVGSLPFDITEPELATLFGTYGSVVAANLVTDQFSGRSKGFAFVEMASGEDARSAISGMHGQSFGGRALVVNAARPREDRPAGGGYGGGGFGGGNRRSY